MRRWNAPDDPPFKFYIHSVDPDIWTIFADPTLWMSDASINWMKIEWDNEACPRQGRKPIDEQFRLKHMISVIAESVGIGPLHELVLKGGIELREVFTDELIFRIQIPIRDMSI